MKRTCWAVLADILAVVSFGLSTFIAFRFFPNCNNTGFDYQAVLVGIVGAIFTLLVGWNIYQAIDWKNQLKQVEEMRIKMDQEIKYIHEKTNYNQAITYANMSQMLSTSFAPNERTVIKFQMVLEGLIALKSLSALSGMKVDIEIQAVVDTLIKGLNNSKDIHLSEKNTNELLLCCGEICNRGNIQRFDKLFELIKNC